MKNTVIVGAGPYGLSVAAHFRRQNIPFRIFGHLMDSWVSHMPKGMLLKSDGFASNICEPDGDFTLQKFCAETGIEYKDTDVPVRLDTFCAYGRAFRDRKVPELEEKNVVSIARSPNGFVLKLDTGETVNAGTVVLAVGITHFEYLPETLVNLPKEFVTHSADHADVAEFRGRSVVVIGGGASALDVAGLLHEAGAHVELVARKKTLKFHGRNDREASRWQKLRRPPSGLGPGWKSWFFANWPSVFYYLPESLRLEAVRRALGPAGGAFIKEKVVGKVPLHLGCTIQDACMRDGRVVLNLVQDDGTKSEVTAEHVIAATGYKVDIDRLQFLSADIRRELKSINRAPVLSSNFESSVPGLYFVGIAAANSFGPVMRFAFGSGFAARRVTNAVAKAFAREPVNVTAAASATTAK